MTDARLAAMRRFVVFGLPNAWTDEAADMIRELLADRETLAGPYKRLIERKNDELRCYRELLPGRVYSPDEKMLVDVAVEDYDMMG